MSQSNEETVAPNETRGRVFLSYSRGDNLSFADQLAKGLEIYGRFRVSIDRNSIVGGEAWELRTTQLIQTADTVVFALSPDSVTSHFCNWEIDIARQAGKRILTVVSHAIEDASVPEALRPINRIYFYPDTEVPGSGFVSGLTALIEALSMDLAWIREHSQVAEAATRWDGNGRDVSDLYSGSRLARALEWRNARPANAPEVTRLQNIFLDSSEAAQQVKDHAARRLLLRIALATVAGIIVFAGLLTATLRIAARNADTNAILFSELSQGAFEADNYTASMRWALAGLHLDSPESAPGNRLAAIRLGEAQRLQPLQRKWQWPHKDDPLFGLALSNDGKKLGIVSSKRVIVLDAERFTSTGFSLEREGEADFEGTRISFSPDGKRLLVVKSFAPTWARIYDLGSSKIVATLAVDTSDIIPCAEYAPDGKTVLTAHLGGFVQIWDAAAGALRLTLDKHYAGQPLSEGNRLNCASFSPDGTRVVTVGNDGAARLWDARTGETKEAFQIGIYATDAAVSPDGLWIVVAGANGVATVFDVAGGGMVAQLAGHQASIDRVRISRDGSLALTVSYDGSARIWSMTRAVDEHMTIDIAGPGTPRIGAHRMTLKGNDIAIRAAMIEGKGNQIFTIEDSVVRVWAARAWDASRTLSPPIDQIVEVAPNGKWFLAFGPASPTAIWDIAPGGPTRRVVLSSLAKAPMSARIPASGDVVVVSLSNGSVATFDARTGKMLRQFRVKNNLWGRLAVSPDAKRVAIGTENEGVGVFDLHSGKLIRRFKGHKGPAIFLQFTSPQTIISTTVVGQALAWNADVGTSVGPPIEAGEFVSATTVSPDGRLLLTADQRGTLKLWDIETGRERWHVKAHLDMIDAVKFSANGNSILSASRDNTAKVWDVLTGQAQSTLSHDSAVGMVAWGAGGVTALTQDDSKRLMEWNLRALFEGSLPARVKVSCAALQRLDERQFLSSEMVRPILRTRSSRDNDPCTNKDPMTVGWWLGQ